MPQWEYGRITWDGPQMTIWPAIKFDLDGVRQKFASGLEGINLVEDNLPPGTFPYYHVKVDQTHSEDVFLALIQYLGSEGWETIHIDETQRTGRVWLKRTL